MVLVSIIPLVRFDNCPYNHINELLNNYAKKKRILFVNPLKEFSKYNSVYFCVSLFDGHYNAKTNFILAEILSKYLLDNDLENLNPNIITNIK